ncbi:MAG: hemerythrin domain-containing protein [Burkholderiales bacterium]|nr:hemerythrin domain-containing protein [Burkholderiales bacterium]
MKRHPSLIQLSREHHHALLLAKRAKADAPDRERLAAEIAFAFHHEIGEHFRTEESGLLVELARAGQERLVKRTLSEHETLKAIAARLESGDLACLRDFGEAMEAHVRFEERELFPLAESLLSS